MLVTGGAGFIGRHLVRSLSRRGCSVTVLDITEFGTEIPVKAVYRKDIRNTEAVQSIIRKHQIDTCIHLAAKVSVQHSIANPDDTLDTNVKGTMSLLEASARCSVNNFIFASSAAVYGQPTQLPLREDQLLKPISPYGTSKATGEELVAASKAYGKIKNGITLRFFNVYGENQNPAYAGVITRFIERLSRKLPPIIYGDGGQTRDFISVNDVVRAIEIAAESDLSGPFNVGSGQAVSINELAERMSSIFGLDLRPVYKEAIQGDIMHSYADTTKTATILRFSAKHTLDLELKKMLTNSAIIRK